MKAQPNEKDVQDARGEKTASAMVVATLAVSLICGAFVVDVASGEAQRERPAVVLAE
jgi:hypothetical protein